MKNKLNKLLILSTSIIATSGILTTSLSSCAVVQDTTDETVGIVQYQELGQESMIVTGLTNASDKIKSITVPATVNGRKVTSINKGAFKNCPNLQKISLPFIGRSDGATKAEGMFGWIFGEEMYDGCGAITWQIYTTDDTNEVVYGKYAIPNSLTNVEITNAKKIPDGAFSMCKFLEEININKSEVESIGIQSFYFCASLQSFNFANLTKLKTIGTGAFQRCYTIETIEIPNTVKTIKASGFADCIAARTAFIPNSVDYVGDDAFVNFYGGLLMIEAKAEEIESKWSPTWTDSDATMVFDYQNGGYKYIDDWLVIMCGKDNDKYGYLAQWMGNWQQTSITIPSTLNDNGTEIKIKEIGGRCFYQNYYIKNLTIQEGIEKIFPSTFEQCTSLEYITIPESLKVIGSYAFKLCTNLKGQFYGEVKTNGIDFKNVEIIGQEAFYGCASIQDVDLSVVQKIYARAFAYCTHLCPAEDSCLLIPKTCDYLGEEAFKWCFKYAPEGVTATYYYPSIKIGTGSKLVDLPNGCFKNCGVRNLKPTTGEDAGTQYPRYIRVNMDFNFSEIERIGDELFRDTWLAKMQNARDTKITYIGDYSFYNSCPTSDPTKPEEAGLPDLQMDDCIEYIGDYAFYGNTTIQKLTFNANDQGINNLKHLGQYAFAGCTHTDFTELDLSPCKYLKSYWGEEGETYNLAHSPYRAFYNCTNLRTVKLPDTETFNYIPERMFDNCTSLGNDTERTALVMSDKIVGIRYCAFIGCKNLTKVECNGVMQHWGGSIFANCQSLESITKTGGQPVKFASDIATSNIGSSCYSGCTKLVNPPIPCGETGKYTLNSSMFANNLALETIKLPDNINNIGSSCFSECTNLKTVELTDESILDTISSNAFYQCKSLESIDNLLTRSTFSIIGTQAFDGCESLSGDLDFTKTGLYSIGDYAFRDCAKLTSIKLKNRSINFGSKPFAGCTNLKKVYFSCDSTNISKTNWAKSQAEYKITTFKWKKASGGGYNDNWVFTYVDSTPEGNRQFICENGMAGLEDLIFEYYPPAE